MSRLFDRSIWVTGQPEQGQPFVIKGLRMVFRIVKTAKVEANTLRLDIYNLTDETVKELTVKGLSITVTAGYVGFEEVLFKGDVRSANDAWTGIDRVTTIEAGDGDCALRTRVSSESHGPGTPAKSVIVGDAGKCGLSIGEVQGLDGKTVGKGISSCGMLRDRLEWGGARFKVDASIQNGELRVIEKNRTSSEEVVVLNPDTGLLHRPSSSECGRRVVSLLNPKLVPGRGVLVESSALKGLFKVVRVVHRGDTHGAGGTGQQGWTSEIEIEEAPAKTSTTTPTMTRVLKNAFDCRISNVRVAMPGEVTKYDAATQKAEVQPLLKHPLPDGKSESLPVITDVPVIWPRAGKALLSFPLSKGDGVLLVFTDRSLDEWTSDGGQVCPEDPRTHDLNDAVAIPGLYPFNERSDADPEDVLLKFGDTELRIEPSGNFEVKTKAGYLRIGADGKVALGGVEELVGLLDGLIDALIGLKIPLAPAGTGVPLNLSDFVMLKTKLATIKE